MGHTLEDSINTQLDNYQLELKCCYCGVNFSADLTRFNRVKNKFNDYAEMDFYKRNVLLNELITLKNVFSVPCLLRTLLSLHQKENWSTIITLLCLLGPVNRTLYVNNRVVDIPEYIDQNIIRGFSRD
jgi:hypothetical protein